MVDLILPRRKFLIGLAALVAAPAIVRASSLMKVKVVPRHIIYVNRTIRTAADLDRLKMVARSRYGSKPTLDLFSFLYDLDARI